MKYSQFALTLSLSVFLLGCQKDNKDAATDQNCKKIQNVKLKSDQTSYTVGDDIHITVTDVPDIALYSWQKENGSTETGDETYDIFDAEKGDEGWYYLNVSYSDCESHTDSIYISVKNKVVPAPCNPDNNVVTFSSIPDINPATITWSFNSGANRRILAASGGYGYPDFKIYFNTSWDITEPEDGEYSVTSLMNTDEYPPYTVYISSLYSSVLFQGNSGKVYISHVNGKLKVTFCDISLSGTLGGPSYTTTATGALTAP